MGNIQRARQEYECDRCLGTIQQGEQYEREIVKVPAEITHGGNEQFTICHFHIYDCINGKPDMYHLQDIDEQKIKRNGTA